MMYSLKEFSICELNEECDFVVISIEEWAIFAEENVTNDNIGEIIRKLSRLDTHNALFSVS